MAEHIAPDSKVSDIVGTLSNPTEYVRRIIENFVGDKFDRQNAVVRIGVTGAGIVPHYKIEYPTIIKIAGVDHSMKAARIYHGSSHKEMKTFANEDAREEHWSTASMSFGDLTTLIGELRKKRKN